MAEEIRKLAEQVLYSSKNIHTLVETVTTNTNEVSYNTEKVSEKIQVQANSIEDTIDSFKNILGEVEKITPEVKEVSQKLNMTMDKKILFLIMWEQYLIYLKNFQHLQKRLLRPWNNKLLLQKKYPLLRRSLQN